MIIVEMHLYSLIVLHMHVHTGDCVNFEIFGSPTNISYVSKVTVYKALEHVPFMTSAAITSVVV